MIDLYFGIVAVLAVSVILFCATFWATREFTPWARDLLAVLTIISLGFYIRDFWDNVLLARLLPYSNLIVIGNWFPMGTAILGAVAIRRIPGKWFRKSISLALLFGAAVGGLIYPVLGEPPACDNDWEGVVCRQTTQATCSAAAGATLLHYYGIETTEQEMAELCLTRQGTMWMGLYRGLKLKTAGTSWDVEVFSCSVQQLGDYATSPVIMNTGVDHNQPVDPEFLRTWGWTPGTYHSTGLMRVDSIGGAYIADPARGMENWSADVLGILWKGTGLRLIPRDN